MKLPSKLLLLMALFPTLSFARMAIALTGSGQPGSFGGGRTITCSSNNGRRNYCNSFGANPRDIVLSRQISGSPCNRGDTWGVDNRGLWVDRGCRAEFSIRGNNWGNNNRVITCSSNNGRRNYCNIPPRANVTLNRQISGSPCVRGRSWGVDNRGLWVDNGCRAEFLLR